jgi:hypothetical protein
MRRRRDAGRTARRRPPAKDRNSAVITGLTYAGFSAFVLEAMGKGAAATKHNVFGSLSNTPIRYMTRIDGWAHTRHGPAGMLCAEALLGMIGLVAFSAVFTAARRFGRNAPPAAGPNSINWTPISRPGVPEVPP